MWRIFLLILCTSLYSVESEMPKHPLYETFQALVKAEPKNLEFFQPVCAKYVVGKPYTSTDYKKMGCLILAGGQGTRLGVDGPKGCVELLLKERKSLFQILLEKVKAKGDDLPVAIMTSPLNHEATVAYLKKQGYYGLKNVEIFQQRLIPMCDDQGRLFFESEDQVAQAPDGNGKALMHLYQNGVWHKWKDQGVDIVQVIPIDNPLAEPFDEELLGVHQKFPVDLVLKCIKRETPEEKLGVIGIENEKLSIREYSELTSSMRSLVFAYGNSGLFSCSMDFVKKVSTLELPWHLARKLADTQGQKEKIWIWKFETFIFDIFPYANSFKIVVGDRRKCFAPLKNLSGPDSLETVAEALMSDHDF